MTDRSRRNRKRITRIPEGKLSLPLGFKSALKSIGKSLGIAISFSSSDLKAIYSPDKLTFLKDGTEFTTTLFHRYINLSSDLDDLFDTNEIDAHGRPVITDLKTDTGFSEELIKWVSFISPQSLPSPRFVLTHDVDIPNKNDFLRSFKFIPKNAQLKDLFKYYSSFILKLGRIALNPKNDFFKVPARARDPSKEVGNRIPSSSANAKT